MFSSYDILDRRMLWELRNAGVDKIITRSKETTHIDLKEATRMGFKVANAPDSDQSPENIARQTFRNLNAWDKGSCVGKACCCQKVCNIDKKKVTAVTDSCDENQYSYGKTGN